MLLLSVGGILLFLEMVLWFRITFDAGLHHNLCLGACFVIMPLFLHTMHKLGWAVEIVNEEALVEKRHATTPTPEDLRAGLRTYTASKGGECLALDRDEFLALLEKPWGQVTSVQRAFAKQIFDAHVESELGKLGEVGKQGNDTMLNDDTGKGNLDGCKGATTSICATSLEDMELGLPSSLACDSFSASHLQL